MSTRAIALVEHHLFDFLSKREQGQEREHQSDDQHGIELPTSVPAEALKVEREHGLVVVESLGDCVGTEQDPAEVHDEESE